MQMKDATRRFGSVVLFIPLILIFLTVADTAFACPGSNTGVAYRTRSINTRTVSAMPTTVITYRAPAAYGRCGDNMYDTLGRRYVAVRRNNYYNGSSERYVGGYYAMPRTRYVAARVVNVEQAPRYVAVQHRYPVYRLNDTTYAEIRSGYRRDNGIVRVINFDDDAQRYAVVRRTPAVRYVAVRGDNDYYDEGSTRYVAVRRVESGCMRGCLDPVETSSMRRVVLRNDDTYPVHTRHVVVDDDDDNNVILRSESERGINGKYVVNEDVDDGDVNDYDVSVGARNDDNNIILRSESERGLDGKYAVDEDSDDNDTSMLVNDSDDEDAYVAVHERPSYVEFRDAAYSTEPVASETISYVPVSNRGDFDDQAILDRGGTTYVVADDVENACLRHTGTRAVSYVPTEYVDDHASQGGSDTTYILAGNTARFPDDMDYDNTTVTVVPVENIRYRTVSYVPVESVNDLPAERVNEDDCSRMVSSVETEPVDVADDSTAVVAEGDDDVIAAPSNVQIASHYGFRDGFEDGQEAALERDVYHPENSGDFRKATEGYESDFGDKDVYKDNYRSSYLRGYQAGFMSVGGTG